MGVYTKNTWVDEVLADDETYLVKNDAGATVYSNAKISLASSVITAGTAMTAALMNNIEDGIDALDTLVDIHAATGKTTPADNDELTITDSADSYSRKKLTWANLKATIKSYYDSVTATLTNKRITKRVASTASSASYTPNSDSYDVVTITAQAAAIQFNSPSGTPTSGQQLIIRLKDNGTARAITWNAAYRAVGVALPSTTVVSKTMYLGFIWNSTDSKWDLIASGQEE
jgi:hypothetical protein